MRASADWQTLSGKIGISILRISPIFNPASYQRSDLLRRITRSEYCNKEERISAIVVALKNLFNQAGEINSARVDAVNQTSITLNHEINNPLTVVLGNVQLILLKGDQLPEEVKARLEIIEQAGLRIRDAVAKLINMAEVKSITYVDNIKMIDIRGAAASDE